MANEIKKQYVKELKAIIRSNTHSKFVDWRGVRMIAKEADVIIREAETKSEQNDYSEAFDIASAVFDVLVPKLGYIDDSGGYLGDNIRAAESLISKIIVLKLPENLQREMYKYFLSTYDNQRFEGWDWHLMMLQFCIEVARTPKEFEAIKQRIETIAANDNYGVRFDYLRGQELTAKIILKTQSEEDYLRYLQENISNSAFRKILIELAIENQNFEEAMGLVNDVLGENKDYSNYLSYWHEYKLQIYEQLNDALKIIELARQSLVFSYDGDHRHYYELLKKNISGDDWDSYIYEIVTEILRIKGINYLNRVYEIWKWEERLDKMMEVTAVANSLYFIEEREKDFFPHNSIDLVECYTVAILSFVADSMERKRYKAACRYIRKIKKLGYPQRAAEIISELRRAYPQRTALLDELDAI